MTHIRIGALLRTLALALALLWVAGTVYAHARGSITPTHGRTHTVRVYCRGWAEDSAAHLRLVSFDNGHATYVCKRSGY